VSTADVAKPAFVPREGDQLVIAYPEVTIGLGSNSYSSVKVGGLIYTRVLRDADDADEQYRKIYAFLEQRAVRDGREKVKLFQEELKRARGGA
jgi:hypothetical protein